jgi:hypothetical protein
VNISGGSAEGLSAGYTSTANISGGSMNFLNTWDSPTVNLHARSFHLGDGLSLDGIRVLGTGLISGEWLDGSPWALDITSNGPEATIRIMSRPGDANGDGEVNLIDLGVLAVNWGRTDATACWRDSDFDASGAVDLSDLGILATNWGTGVEAVPEPGTISLLALGGLAMLRRWRASCGRG